MNIARLEFCTLWTSMAGPCLLPDPRLVHPGSSTSAPPQLTLDLPSYPELPVLLQHDQVALHSGFGYENCVVMAFLSMPCARSPLLMGAAGPDPKSLLCL